MAAVPANPADWTPDQIEQAFEEAIRRNDLRVIEAALLLMGAVDPDRADRLYDSVRARLGVQTLFFT